MAIIAMSGTRMVFISSSLPAFLHRYPASHRMSASLANSAGCTCTGPALIQRRDPLAMIPIPGINTTTSATMLTIIAGLPIATRRDGLSRAHAANTMSPITA